MDIEALIEQHRFIIENISILGGVGGDIKTRGDANEARQLIDKIDPVLVAHLAIEDDELYPLLLNSPDTDLRTIGVEAFESMIGIYAVWVQFREYWTADAMLADTGRFAAATSAVVGALSMRIEMEQDSLYPAAEVAMRAAARASGTC